MLPALTQALLMPPPPALRRRPSSHPSSFFHSDRTARHAAAGREGGGREGGVDWEELLADPKEGEQVVDLDFIDASSLISQLQDADGRGVDGLFLDDDHDEHDEDEDGDFGDLDFDFDYLDDLDDDEDAFNEEDLVERAWRDHGLLPEPRPLLPWNSNDNDGNANAGGSSNCFVDDGDRVCAERLAEVVRRDGVTRVDGVLSAATAAELRAFVLDLLAEEEEKRKKVSEAGGPEEATAEGAAAGGIFSAVLSPSDSASAAAAADDSSSSSRSDGAPKTTRWDIRLPLNDVVRRATEELLGNGNGREEGGPSLLGAAMAELAGAGEKSSQPSLKQQQQQRRRKKKKGVGSSSSSSSKAGGGGFGRVALSSTSDGAKQEEEEEEEEAAGGGAASGVCGACEVWELAALVSAPGSAPQIVHSDTEEGSQAPVLFTAFVALQPVPDRVKGPTRFLVGTHRPEAHAAFREGRHAQEFLPTADVAEALLGAGDASLYDGRLLHCGGPNTYGGISTSTTISSSSSSSCSNDDDEKGDDDGVRVLFYVTVRHRDADADALGNAAAHSIQPEYAGSFQLRDFYS